jgi:anti-anti-sigma factor
MTIEVAPIDETLDDDVLLDELELSCVHEKDRAIVYAVGELDAASSVRLRRLLSDLIRVHSGRITVDLSGVTFMDSSGLGALLASRVSAQSVGIGFAIAYPSKQVTRVLQMTGTYERLVG